MKIAIFHNYLDNIGGSERVVLTLARDLPADVYSTNIDKDKIERMGFRNISLKSIGRVPINAPFKQQMALWKFHHLNLKDKYDFYITAGDWCISGAVNHRPNISYIHSPTREIWNLYEYTRQNRVSLSKRFLFDLWVRYNRNLSRNHIKYVDKVVCNSINTQKRVKRYLKRDSVVINPPVETSQFHYKENGDYWLSVNRLVHYKRIEMQMEAFAKLPDEKLIVVGSHGKSKHFQDYVNYIHRIKPDNVTLLESVSFNELVELYAHCKGFITTSKEEDFGMTPAEAMASGKPVIAPNEGGYKETVINELTGRLIDNINVDKLIESIKEIGKHPESYKNTCLKQAERFDASHFIKKIRKEIQS